MSSILPKGNLPTITVTLSGGDVKLKSLTLSQSKIVGGLKGDAMIVAAIAFATGETRANVKAWLEEVPAGDGKKLLAAVTEVSGLNEGAQFQE